MVKKVQKTAPDISKHVLVPKHTKLSEQEKEALFAKYKITINELPRISMKDPAVAGMELTTKDVIKIVRDSKTAGETDFFRRVVK